MTSSPTTVEVLKKARAREWQPIESAPDHGEDIIVFGGRHDKPTVVPADGGWWRSPTGAPLKSRPTHWMHMPEPPRAIALASEKEAGHGG